MASLLFLAFLLTINGLLLSDSLVAFANQNPNNYLMYIVVYTFIFFLVPFEFISAIILLLFHVALPQSAFFIKHLTMATQFLVSTTLLVGVPLIVIVIFHITFTFTEAVVLIGAATVTAAAVAIVYKYNPFKRYFNSAGQIVSISVPAFAALCISTGTFLSFSYQNQNHENPFILVPIQLFLLILNCVNFVLAMVLLFLHIYMCVPTEGQPTLIPAVLVEFFVEAVLAMSFTTTGLIGFYMVVALAPLVRII